MTIAADARRVPFAAIGVGSIAGLLLAMALAGTPLGRDAGSTSPFAEPDFLLRTAGISRDLMAAEQADLERLRIQAERFASGPQDTELILFAGWWARFDPEAAYTWARALDMRTGHFLRTQVLRTWAREDPVAALEVATSNPILPGLDRAVHGSSIASQEKLAVLIGWDHSLVPGLEEWVFEHEAIEQQMLVQVLTRHRVATRGPEVTWEWARRWPDSTTVLLSVASAIAERDPDEAVRLASPLISDGSAPGLVTRIAHRWSRRAPRAALEWLATTPAGAAQRDAVTDTARNWNSNDQPGFFAYMNAHLDEFPKWLEPAFGLYARALTRHGRASEGLALVSRFREGELRSYNTILILRQWLTDDREAASHWLENHELPEPILRRAGYRGGAS